MPFRLNRGRFLVEKGRVLRAKLIETIYQDGHSLILSPSDLDLPDSVRAAERQPTVAGYWRRCDPPYQDGSGAESFADLLFRIRDILERFKHLPDGNHILVFTHGQWM